MEGNPAIPLFLALGIVLLGSRLGGTIARQLGQARVLGELIVGVVLGPTVLNMLNWPILYGVELESTLSHFAELGVLFLMFIVGLEVDIRELAKVGNVALIAGALGAVVPVVLVLPIVLAFGHSWQQGLFAGVTLAATSVSISAQVLLELGYLRTKEGSALLATALVDDIIAILLVSLAIAVTGSAAPGQTADAGSLVGIIVRMALYLIVALALAWVVVPRAMNWIADQPRLAQSYGILAFGFILMLGFAWTAEALGGVAAITGAFIAGVGLSRTHERTKHQVEDATRSIAYGLLVPVFFVDVGLRTNLSAFPLSALPLALLLLLAGIASKVVGSGLGAKLGGFNNTEALRVGVCMISRGEVGLIIAALAVSSGVLSPDDPLFSSLFLVILLTTLVTPPLVRWVFRERRDINPPIEPPLTDGAQAS